MFWHHSQGLLSVFRVTDVGDEFARSSPSTQKKGKEKRKSQKESAASIRSPTLSAFYTNAKWPASHTVKTRCQLKLVLMELKALAGSEAQRENSCWLKLLTALQVWDSVCVSAFMCTSLHCLYLLPCPAVDPRSVFSALFDNDAAAHSSWA